MNTSIAPDGLTSSAASKRRSSHASAVYTIADFAALTGSNYSTIWEQIQAGTLPVMPFRLGAKWLFSKRAVDELLGIGDRGKGVA